ncbi:hypothetical protein [Pelagibius marinus]|uniref:hypothetical protein n=1 Tax=Pelagibius marinus TaxID=2762760 RepID=UPI0018724853|nr:hypothetical protein [Pelagibius marinus]
MGARNLRLPAVLAAALATMTIALPQAEAYINDVTPSPAKARIASVGPATVAVNWNVERISPDTPNPGTVSSSAVQVFIDGISAGNLPRSVSQTTKGEVYSEILRLREVVMIPQAMVYRAVKEGASLTLRRVFTDTADNSTENGEFEVTPTGEGSVALSVQRLELTFDDKTRSRVLPKDSELRVVAEINTSGVGLLQAQWEVASATSTAGAPMFHPLALVRQGVGAGGRAVLTSPPLPTGAEGTHLVRLRMIEPGLAFDAPTLQYYVTPKSRPAPLSALREILLTGPRPGTPLTAETLFSWNALDGADAYQLSFFAVPSGPAEPLDPARDTQATAEQMTAKTVPAGEPAAAGIFVPGGRTSASLEAFTLAQLADGKRYLWMVTAIDANGAIIGTSPAREIHKP